MPVTTRSIRAHLADSARAVAAARRRCPASIRPVFDTARWEALLDELADLEQHGDHATAEALIEGWRGAELATLTAAIDSATPRPFEGGR